MAWTLECEHPFAADLVVRRFRLHSGLRLLLLADPATPIFSYQTWVGVGSRHERAGQTGTAHLFEHLMFNQTRSLAPGELDRLIEATGGDTNAATWVDWTYYRDNLPAHELELVVRLEADRLHNLVLEDGPLEAEREVVIHERMQRVDDDVEGFVDEQLMKLAFTVHPYHHPTIGWMEDIRGLTRADVQGFYRMYYAPNNATLVLCGDVDEARALDLIEAHYGTIPAVDLPTETSVPEPAQTEERRARFAKPVAADRVEIGYRVPGQGDPDWLILGLVGDLLTAGPSTRLHRRLVVDEEAAIDVDAGTLPFRDPSLLCMSVTMNRGHTAAEAERAIDEALADLAAKPVSEAELAKVKNGAETDYFSQLASCEGKAEALGHYQTTLGDFRELFRVVPALRAVTATDIARVTGAYLTRERRTVVIAEPGESDDDTPDGEEVA
jgi:zinc protease